MAEPEKTYEARAETLEEAVKKAHAQIPAGFDEIIVSRVVEWGYRSGGLAGENYHFHVTVAQVGEPWERRDQG